MNSSTSFNSTQSDGSSTMILCSENVEETRQLILRLRIREEEETQKKKGIRWEEGTIDNEHLCKKSSKRCRNTG